MSDVFKVVAKFIETNKRQDDQLVIFGRNLPIDTLEITPPKFFIKSIVTFFIFFRLLKSGSNTSFNFQIGNCLIVDHQTEIVRANLSKFCDINSLSRVEIDTIDLFYYHVVNFSSFWRTLDVTNTSVCRVIALARYVEAYMKYKYLFKEGFSKVLVAQNSNRDALAALVVAQERNIKSQAFVWGVFEAFNPPVKKNTVYCWTKAQCSVYTAFSERCIQIPFETRPFQVRDSKKKYDVGILLSRNASEKEIESYVNFFKRSDFARNVVVKPFPGRGPLITSKVKLEEDISKFIDCVDLVYSWPTTAAYQIVLLGCPILFFDTPKLESFAEFSQLESTIIGGRKIEIPRYSELGLDPDTIIKACCKIRVDFTEFSSSSRQIKKSLKDFIGSESA